MQATDPSQEPDLPGRLYTPDRLGPRCPVCHTHTVLALVNAERNTLHPTCRGAAARF